ncbi:MAG: ribonuclease HIII [Verrucomicrobiota bacterium]
MSSNSPQTPKIYTGPLTLDQAKKLQSILVSRGWHFEPRPYTIFFAKEGKLTVAVYEKGPKIVVQGKGLEDFIQFILEPEVIGVASFGYEEEQHPDWFSPHLGIDESGKGDFFGPLVIAGAYVDAQMARGWRDAGVMDSKSIGSDSRIRALAKVIKETRGAVLSVVLIGPQRYNELYGKFKNLNRLLAWGHARVIENLLEKKPDCPRALSDQFANPSLIQKALLERGQQIQLDQRTKAESDPAVAAASILAREAFVNWMDNEGRIFGEILPKGASAAVKTTGRKLVETHGPAVLNKIAKLHFKTAAEILSVYQTEYLQDFLKAD